MARLRVINGSYYAYFYDRHRTPKEKSYPLRVSQKSAAKTRLRRLETAYAEGTFDPWNPGPESKPLTLSDALEAFLEERSHLRPKSVEAYRTAVEGVIRQAPAAITLDLLSAKDLRPYVEDAAVSEATRGTRYRHLHAFFGWAVKAGHVTASPLHDVRRPAPSRKEADFLTPDDVERLITLIGASANAGRAIGWLADVVLFAVTTGLRRGEICALRWGDVDLSSGFITVRSTGAFRPKSGHERRVPLVGDARAVIEQLRAGKQNVHGEPVFLGVEGEALNAGYLTHAFKEFARRAGFPEGVHFHSLRHTAASWMTMRGVNLTVVQRVLGHQSLAVTQRYAHLSPDAMTDAMKGAFERVPQGPPGGPAAKDVGRTGLAGA